MILGTSTWIRKLCRRGQPSLILSAQRYLCVRAEHAEAAIDQGHLLSIVVLAVAVAMMHLERPLARAQTTLALRGRELTDAGRVVPPATAGDVALRAPFTSLVSNGNCH